MVYVVSILIALLFGSGLSLNVMSRRLNKSNNKGDTKAGMRDFSFKGLDGVKVCDVTSDEDSKYEYRNPNIKRAMKDAKKPFVPYEFK